MAENNNAYHVVQAGPNSFIKVANNKINGETVTRLAIQINGSGMSLPLTKGQALKLIQALTEVSDLSVDEIDAGRLDPQ